MRSSSDVRPFDFRDLRQSPAGPQRPAFEICTSFEETGARTGPVTLEEAYQEGLAEGERLGRSATQKELTPVVAAFGELVRALHDLRSRRLAELESELVDVASEVARRILHGELQQDGDAVLRMARAAIGSVRDEETLILRLAPGDLELVRTHAVELEQELVDRSLVFAPDPTIERGGVVLETPTRCVEGRPERALELMRDRVSLDEALASDPALDGAPGGTAPSGLETPEEPA